MNTGSPRGGSLGTIQAGGGGRGNLPQALQLSDALAWRTSTVPTAARGRCDEVLNNTGSVLLLPFDALRSATGYIALNQAQ
jgi:hypothetical protein